MTVDLEFLSKQNERVLNEMASFRDDMRVLTAIVMRLDNTMTHVLEELRASHAQVARLGERVRKLEDAQQ